MAIVVRSRHAKDVEHASPDVVALARDDEQGHVIPPQTHTRAQFLYAVEGVMRVRTPEGMWIIPPQRALWIPVNVEHEVTMLSRVSMRTIYIKERRASEFGPDCRLIEVSGLLRELILALLEEPVEYLSDSRGSHLAQLILLEIVRAPMIPIVIPWPRDRRLISVCEAIMKDPGQQRSLEDWADVAGASPRTLIRLFQNETGLHFRHWVQQVQLAEALSCLAREESIGQISRRLGYANPSAFTSMFRRALGVTPSQYLQHRIR
ncbi:MAG TPA: helix-turn-helix transcriptional regulator [Afipia sp.]